MSRPHPLFGHPDLLELAVPVATVWTSPEAPRDLDVAAVADVPDPAAWAAALAGGGREASRGLHGRTLTQLLLGEPFWVQETRGAWVRGVAPGQRSARHPQGYPGWVRRAHLDAPVPRWQGAAAWVVVPRATLTCDGREQVVSGGTGLWLTGVTEDAAVVALPGGRSGTLALHDVRLSHKHQRPTYGTDDLLATARQLLGLAYLWGGTSAWGVDCSGLVHLTYRTHQMALPRDAADQATAPAVEEVPVDRVRPGDLYFFAGPDGRVDHVAFATGSPAPDGTRPMLHAPEDGGVVEEVPMTPERAARLVGAGRVRKPAADGPPGRG